MNHTSNQQNWQRHLRAWQSSGLSQAAYCKAQQLSPASFNYWAKKKTLNPRAAALPALIPIVRELPQSGIQLRSPSGWQILLPTELDITQLGKLLARLA